MAKKKKKISKPFHFIPDPEILMKLERYDEYLQLRAKVVNGLDHINWPPLTFEDWQKYKEMSLEEMFDEFLSDKALNI